MDQLKLDFAPDRQGSREHAEVQALGRASHRAAMRDAPRDNPVGGRLLQDRNAALVEQSSLRYYLSHLLRGDPAECARRRVFTKRCLLDAGTTARLEIYSGTVSLNPPGNRAWHQAPAAARFLSAGSSPFAANRRIPAFKPHRRSQGLSAMRHNRYIGQVLRRKP